MTTRLINLSGREIHLLGSLDTTQATVNNYSFIGRTLAVIFSAPMPKSSGGLVVRASD